MIRMLSATFLAWLCIVSGAKDLQAQSLSFSTPGPWQRHPRTDKTADIVHFKNAFFLAWKEAGNSGKIHMAYLGSQCDTSGPCREEIIPGAQTAFAPVWQVLNDRLYLLWIGEGGELKYILNREDTAMAFENICSLPLTGNTGLSGGIAATAAGKDLLLASHGTEKRRMVFAIVHVREDGLLQPSRLLTVPGERSADCPGIAGLGDSLMRFCWRNYRDQRIHCRDYDIRTHTWTVSFSLSRLPAGTAPVVFHAPDGRQLFYIWTGRDGRLYYTSGRGSAIPSGFTAIPGYFSTGLPVSVCMMDGNGMAGGNGYMLGYTGEDQRIYLSRFLNYNPATWMNDLLQSGSSDYTLMDIVLPGAHDAGMSVLSGVGGTSSGTINDCNTLTQVHSVGGQLRAGIRMFDLRVGVMDSVLHAKHASSDCMADGIGGGYGERLHNVLDSIRQFLLVNRGETILLTFSHFCEKEIPVKVLADTVITSLGTDLLYKCGTMRIGETPLRELAGKVIVTFENYSRSDGLIDSCTIGDRSEAFVNFRREYAATNDLPRLIARQESFFKKLSGKTMTSNLVRTAVNDLVRLDWQLTQSADEAAMICNDFQDENVDPVVSGIIMLARAIRKHQSIIRMSREGNKYLPVKLKDWIDQGIIGKHNKPNIIYVDVADTWITDLCTALNRSMLYRK